MKSYTARTAQLNQSDSKESASSGANGQKAIPPAYELDFTDSQNTAVQRTPGAEKQRTDPPAVNNTGLPDNLKAGVESLSGYSMDDVKVHYHSSKPAQINALAYAQGTNIYLGPGQERHLPHEAWHVAQQKQGRVRPTMQMKDKVKINDDIGLEKEADVMGARALSQGQVVQRQKLDGQELTPEELEEIEKLGGAIAQAKFRTPSQANTVIQRAYTARRPLGGKVSFGLKSRLFHNKGVFHEHIFFEDGKAPPDIGFHNGSPPLFQDSKEMLGLYVKIKTGLDDGKMRSAVSSVGDPGKYSLLGNNCQAYVEKVLKEYDKLTFQPFPGVIGI
jgi:hypothetical protein